MAFADGIADGVSKVRDEHGQMIIAKPALHFQIAILLVRW
jgi:hypothetical protein